MQHGNCQVTPPKGAAVLAFNFESGNVWALKKNVLECRYGGTTSPILQPIALTRQDFQKGESPCGKCVRHLLPTLTHKSGVSPIHLFSQEREQMANQVVALKKGRYTGGIGFVLPNGQSRLSATLVSDTQQYRNLSISLWSISFVPRRHIQFLAVSLLFAPEHLY